MTQSLRNYKKIYIVGACGSGKTTLAKKLSKRYGIPYFSLDNIYRYEKSRKIRPEIKRTKILNCIFQRKTWIIEGAQTKDWTGAIWKNCDVVLLVNPSIIKRFLYITKRYISTIIRGKPDGGILLNFRSTLKFKKHDLPKFQIFAKQYNKTISDSAKMPIV